MIAASILSALCYTYEKYSVLKLEAPARAGTWVLPFPSLSSNHYKTVSPQHATATWYSLLCATRTYQDSFTQPGSADLTDLQSYLHCLLRTIRCFVWTFFNWQLSDCSYDLAHSSPFSHSIKIFEGYHANYTPYLCFSSHFFQTVQAQRGRR